VPPWQARQSELRPDTSRDPNATSAVLNETDNYHDHGHADNFAVGLLCEMVGYGVPVVVVPHCKPQLASHPAFGASLDTLHSMGVRVLFDPDAPYESRLPSWAEVTAAPSTPSPARWSAPGTEDPA
jgi:hypothetical protein